MSRRNLYKRLERVEARLASTRDGFDVMFVNGKEPGGPTCVRGPDGRLVWGKPPAGCKAGELLDARDTPGHSPLRVIFVSPSETQNSQTISGGEDERQKYDHDPVSLTDQP
jgi:hypothetical protein